MRQKPLGTPGKVVALLDPIHIDPKTFLRDHCTLPALPEVLARMQEILEGEQIDIDEVVDPMRSEPALVGQVLKMVNSAYYGLPREVGDVKYAIAFLGFSEIHRIMLSFTIARAFVTDQKEALKELWFHSFHTALCAEHVMKKDATGRHTPDAWSAALLHDVGKLVYLKFFPQHFLAMREYARANGCLFSAAEMEFDLPASAYLGTLLCDHWRLPLVVRDSCESHTLETVYENVSGVGPLQIPVVVSVCNLVSVLSTGTLADSVAEEIARVTMQTLDYDEPAFADLMTVVKELGTDAHQFMSQVT
jgi:HD-like signal output (HDOD) protein